jgi:uracil-DNA glycosylase family 4
MARGDGDRRASNDDGEREAFGEHGAAEPQAATEHGAAEHRAAEHGPAEHEADTRQAERSDALDALTAEVVECRRCPRLVEWRELVARTKTARFATEPYWGRPVPGFGDPRAKVLIVGLAPAAHGGNRTGRVFTGDRSGDFLFASLERTGFANQARSVSRDDGLRLTGAYVAATVRCAPPANRPLPGERDRCLPFLARELRLLEDVRVAVGLGAYGWDGFLRAARANGHPVRRRPVFGHAAEVSVGPWRLLGTFHPSQQNTFTRKLTPTMLDAVFERARAIASL